VPPGDWVVEVDCHAVLDAGPAGVTYQLEVTAASVPPEVMPDHVTASGGAGALTGAQFAAAPVEGAPPLEMQPEFRPRAAVVAGQPGHQSAGDRRPRWLRGDLHVHSRHSDARWSVEDIARYAEGACLDYIAVADHNTTTAYPHLVDSFWRLGVGVLVIPAIELTTFYGHANALGISDWIDWRVQAPNGRVAAGCLQRDASEHTPRVTMAEVAAGVRRRGGVFVVNHPHSAGYPACTGCRWEFGDESAGYASVLEVWNGAWSKAQNPPALRLWDRWLNAGYRVPAVAGTDSHVAPPAPHETGYTYVWAPPSVEGILDAVRRGASFVSCGPQVAWPVEALTSSIDGDRPLTVHVDGLAEPADLRLVRNGRAVDMLCTDHNGEHALQPTGGEFSSGWCRVELRRRVSGSLLACTNPRYAT
jgi:hypothetical protein